MFSFVWVFISREYSVLIYDQIKTLRLIKAISQMICLVKLIQLAEFCVIHDRSWDLLRETSSKAKNLPHQVLRCQRGYFWLLLLWDTWDSARWWDCHAKISPTKTGPGPPALHQVIQLGHCWLKVDTLPKDQLWQKNWPTHTSCSWK